jgi:tetratricopeptide (TPR) repeat protein
LIFSNNRQIRFARQEERVPKVSLKLPSSIFKILLILPTLIIIGTTFFIVKWCFGNAISTQLGNAKTVEEEAVERELGKLAMSLAPDDPQTFYAAGVIQEKAGNLEQFPEIITLYEKAAARSPNDYRYWLALGKIRERAGDSEGGEKAVRKALELAPNYSNINWTLGNILLRRNSIEEAFSYFKKAASADVGLF